MADIFISYAREDASAVEKLAGALEAAGYSVWWDRNLATGARYLEATEAELKSAKAVIVMWTKTSITSHWVADEASRGRDAGRLAPISTDNSMPPLGFGQFQVTDFSHWKGGADEAPFRSLVSALARLVPNGEGVAAPVITKTLRRVAGRRRILILGAIALVAVLSVTIVGVFATSLGTAPPKSPRTAFFGFTAGASDPTVAMIAAAATDETIQGMSAIQIETAARTETLGTLPDQRLGRAEKLGAVYALSGEVRSDGNRINIAVRLEDVPARSTLWEENVNGDATETVSLPVRVAAKATDVVSCLARFRASVPRDDRSLLPLMAKVCSELRRVDTDKIPAVRELARKAPQSAIIQASFAHAASLAYSLAPAATGRTLLDDAEVALKRAAKLDPKGLYVHMARGYVAQAKRVSLIEQKTILDLGFTVSPSTSTDVFPYSMLNFQYAVHLYSIGRTKDSEPYIRASTGTDPYGPYKHALAARLLAERGKTSEAEQRFEQTFARLPTAQVWEMWLTAAIFFGAGDPDMILGSIPAIVSGDTAACWRDISTGVKSKVEAVRLQSAKRASLCAENGLIAIASAIPPLASASDQDDAFRLAERLVPTSFLGETAVLFSPQTRSMRADPRFLQLVEKLGLMEYWRSTKSQPDVCETEDVPFCRELKTAAKP